MITYKKGNVLTGPERHVAHGCNCRGSFGYGIAGQIARMMPRAYDAYMNKYYSSGWKLGEVQAVDCGTKVIYNCATQYNYGNPKKTGIAYASYEAIELVMKNLYEISVDQDIIFAMPKIASDLGGLEWDKVAEVINKVFFDREIIVYEFVK